MAVGDNQIDGYSEGEEPLVFHYQRGAYRRLEPQLYRDLAEGKSSPPRGLFKVLVGTKGNRMLFTVMMLTFALALLLRFLGGQGSAATINGLYCELSAFSFENALYASVRVRTAATEKKKYKDVLPPPRNMQVEFTVVNADGMESDYFKVEDFEFDEKNGTEQFVRATFGDYEPVTVRCLVTSGEKQVELTAPVEQK